LITAGVVVGVVVLLSAVVWFQFFCGRALADASLDPGWAALHDAGVSQGGMSAITRRLVVPAGE
jgi:hypothetical protein